MSLTDSVIPYLGLGYNFNSINWQNYVYDHSGDGYALMGGLILRIEKSWTVNLFVRRTSFSGERLFFSSGDYPNYTTEVYELSANIVYHFNLSQ